MAAPANQPRVASEKPKATTVKGPGAESEGAQIQAFARFLTIESEARRSRSMRELDALAVNDAQRLVRSRQAFVIACAGRAPAVLAASSLVAVDQATPMIRWVTEIVARIGKEKGLKQQVEFALPGYAPPDDELTRQYPFRSVLWQPLWSPDGRLRAGTLYFRESPWIEAERSIAVRLAETFGHARALMESGVRPATSRRRKTVAIAAAVLAAAAGALPVPNAVLAPLQVVPRDADVVAMPFEGIVQQVLVQPNRAVTVGTPLVRLVDTVQRNRAEIAAREVNIAAARVDRATNLAFTDPRGREELGVARAELALKRAEHAYARELLEQAVIKAERAGVAVYSDPRELEGKPLPTGERLMLIAREGEIELRISLPVADSIVLKPGLAVKGFLDSDPLNSVAARITAIDRQVRVDELQVAAYRVTASLVDEKARLTLGARGTAQIQGEHVPLAIYLFRRPMAAIRQWVGL